jgi:hypothetical protein
MSALWKLQEAPQWMKEKRLKFAPNTPGNSHIKNVRSISLYEVICMVWSTTIAKRIHCVLHKDGVLHGAKNKYRLNQGTMMFLLQVINQIERVIYSDTSKYITFWDIRRAFDYIPRNLQKLAWMRIGVSK